jgi:serine/threonine protein kinase/tetratricopeptide (TPR) repeat protein
VPGAPRPPEEAVTSFFQPLTTEAATFAPGTPDAPTMSPATIFGGGQPGPHGARPGWLVPGQKIGARYTIIKLLGLGGMGAVYQAWDDELLVAVAIKVIIPAASAAPGTKHEAEQRFKNELLLARAVTHKNVVRIHDLGTIDGIKYITMSFINGDDLATTLKRDGKFPIARALGVARQIADGMQAAHEAGVVHRDLKPANIMIDAEGHALIMDFGISATAQETAKDGIVGTLEYMAPEQGTGALVDARADIYAFGLILHEMLAGLRSAPLTTQDRIFAMMQRSEEGVPPLHTIDASIPEALSHLVSRCLETDTAARYQSTAELVAALAAIDDAGELIPIPPRVTKRTLGFVAALVLTLLGGSYFAGRSGAPEVPVQHEPVSILITDFENHSGDPAFEGAVEQTLAIALETASYVTVFKTPDARAIAIQLKLSDGKRLTPDIGQLIARREGIKVLVAGSIGTEGSGYRLQLRASDPATGAPIAAADRYAADKTAVLATVGSMAATVREALGESTAEMAASTPGETMTAGSLDAMRAYARAQDLLMTNQFKDALQEYQRAVDLDPQFGRAYAGMAVVYVTYLKQPAKAEEYYKLALNHLDRMTARERYRTLGTYYLNVARNYEKAVENYQQLLESFPADDVAHANLALAHLYLADVPQAVLEGRKSLEIYPRNSILRYNYAMYAMYAGDFSAALSDAARLLKENPTFEYAWLPLALSALAQGDRAGAEEATTRLSEVSATGATLAKQIAADLQMYFGRPAPAVRLLQEGLTLDAKRKSTSEGVPQKHVALGEAHLMLGQRRQAIEAAREAVKLSRHESTLFPAARVLLRAGQEEQALQIAADLEKMLQRQTTAYAGLIRGEIAFQRGRVAEGIEAFRDAQERHNSWFSRFLLGKAYVETDHFAEGLTELELCVKRRGEAADVFFYDMPTLHYLPEAYYWLARAQDGVGSSAEARKSYDQFLNVRAEANPSDPLVVDARKRVTAH